MLPVEVIEDPRTDPGQMPPRGRFSVSGRRDRTRDLLLYEALILHADRGCEDALVGEDIFVTDPKPIEWLIGQLWNSTDTVPALTCQGLDVPQGSTYAVNAGRILASYRRSNPFHLRAFR